MKARLACIVVLLLIVLFFVFVPPKITPKKVSYTELGIPASEQFSTGIRARSPWDLLVYDGYLYVGSGDFDLNTGPAEVWRYDLDKREWETSATLPEEEINRFVLIDGKPTIIGIDPTENWDYGNYYVLEDDAWTQKRVIPNGIHTFDMIEYKGMIFAGLGVPSGEYPIAVSKDGGETFNSVEMTKNGAPLDTTGSETVRVYDLFTFRGNFYALFIYGDQSPLTIELYRYADGRFVFDSPWEDQIKFKPISYVPVRAKAEYKNRLYLTTGNLYVTDTAETLTKIVFPNGETVFDFTVANGNLYVLCAARQEDGTIRTSVWKKTGNAPDSFSEILYYDYPLPPLSIAVSGKTFYIGMAYSAVEHEMNGMILEIEYR